MNVKDVFASYLRSTTKPFTLFQYQFVLSVRILTQRLFFFHKIFVFPDEIVSQMTLLLKRIARTIFFIKHTRTQLYWQMQCESAGQSIQCLCVLHTRLWHFATIFYFNWKFVAIYGNCFLIFWMLYRIRQLRILL